MAKKKEKLSLEEMLEQAIVKEEDRPYEVPGNWLYFYFTSLIDIQGGTQPPKSQFIDVIKEGYVRLVQIRDFASDKYIVYVPMKKNLRLFNKDDILIARYGASIGRICRGLEGACNVALAKTTFSEDVLNRNYVYWLLKSEYFQSPLMTISRTAQAGFNKDDLAEFKLPLPPIAEQQRIVDIIESLFEKLDAAKELAQNALDTFENRKSTILHKAFTGKLTAKWREENGVSLETWEERNLKSLCKISSGGTPSRNNNEYYTGEIPWVKTGEINWNYICDSEEKITECAIKNSSAKLFPIGTVLVAMYGQGLTRGRAAILDIEATTNQAVCALIPNSELLNKYLYYYFMCNYWKLREKAVGGNQPNFSGTMIGRFIMNMPTLHEQKEIVRMLDSLLENEQQAKELCDIIEKIDLMKKAILAKAFHGELGTNDPKEEGTVKLLKEILKQKI